MYTEPDFAQYEEEQLPLFLHADVLQAEEKMERSMLSVITFDSLKRRRVECFLRANGHSNWPLLAQKANL